MLDFVGVRLGTFYLPHRWLVRHTLTLANQKSEKTRTAVSAATPRSFRPMVEADDQGEGVIVRK